MTLGELVEAAKTASPDWERFASMEGRDVTDLQLDLACAIQRIEQAHSDPDMAEFLLDRLATCDAPRLRRYLTPETLALMAETEAGNR